MPCVYVALLLFLFFSTVSHSKEIEISGVAVIDLDDPAGWVLEKDSTGQGCIVLARKEEANKVPTMRICAQEKGGTLAAKEFGFYFEDARWKVGGAFGTYDVQLVDLADKLILKSVVDCGVEQDGIHHAAAGYCFRAMVFGERASVSIEASSVGQAMTAVERIVPRIRPKLPLSKISRDEIVKGIGAAVD